jgi:hypothetical protein
VHHGKREVLGANQRERHKTLGEVIGTRDDVQQVFIAFLYMNYMQIPSKAKQSQAKAKQSKPKQIKAMQPTET